MYSSRLSGRMRRTGQSERRSEDRDEGEFVHILLDRSVRCRTDMDLLCDRRSSVQMFWHEALLPTKPVAVLEPFRIANAYGLFAVMTPHRYEIEFQGSNDGEHWVAYPFRYKPQELNVRPRIYAPYQPRFDWNLWFASLGSWQQNPMVP